MAYDEGLAQRVREALEEESPFSEKKMFGGVCFLVKGNMACGILGDALIVRVGPQRYAEALKAPAARPFDITGRAMKGWVMVSSEGHAADRDLTAWVQRGLEFARSLPPK